MKKKLTSMILAFLSGAAVLTAHEGVERGPNGGRILEFSKDETMHGEVTVKEGKFHIALLDKDMKPVAVAAHTLTASTGDRAKPVKLEVAKAAKAAGKAIPAYVAEQLKSGALQMSCEDPDAPENWPRNLFVWRSNLLGSSGKGHEYFLKHLLGTDHGVMGKDLGEEGHAKPKEAVWHDEAPKGKLDLLVTIDFRMSTTCVYSDIVLPTASWYEKDDLNTSDMHPFIHPLQAAVDPAYESKSDWEIFKSRVSN